MGIGLCIQLMIIDSKDQDLIIGESMLRIPLNIIGKEGKGPIRDPAKRVSRSNYPMVSSSTWYI